MTNQFNRAVSLIIALEGGDKLHSDSGGLTKYGISQRAYPALDIASLTEDDARAIYKRDYWDKVRADELPWPLNLYVFDAAVNQGVSAAIKMLQDATGKVAVDGVLGKKTMAAIDKIDVYFLRSSFMAKRAMRYTGTRHFDKYGHGWLRRLYRVTEHGVLAASIDKLPMYTFEGAWFDPN